ncbi:uncharacterized protein LOC131039642 isoform X2 [Cryptomeria japonica]|uniref:uncharacterized protein LOC131039642 isoform X2 n=1 Tax=Cryptomeria japonica TaxID=3369 RepID=UPI0027DA3284|nr:uncharacterized protein LOC131039642 isoform X2 [Cryptomeria japonica]
MMAPDGDMDKIDANVSALGNGGLTQNVSEPNAMKTQYSAGIEGGSESSGSCSFQFFVYNEDGLNLSVDLNSNPLDWMRACSNGIRVPQHIHRSKPMPMSSEGGSTKRLKVVDFNNSEGTLPDGFHNRSLTEQVGISTIDESLNGCIGKEVPTDLQMVPDGSKATGELIAVQSVACEQRVVYGGTHLNQGVLNDSGQETGDQQLFQAHEAMQNEDGEISRNLQGDGPLENTGEEMNHSQPTIDFQNSERHKIEVKKAPKTNLRTLKTLARGPIVLSDGDTKERRGRRKSARLTDKDLI